MNLHTGVLCLLSSRFLSLLLSLRLFSHRLFSLLSSLFWTLSSSSVFSLLSSPNHDSLGLFRPGRILFFILFFLVPKLLFSFQGFLFSFLSPQGTFSSRSCSCALLSSFFFLFFFFLLSLLLSSFFFHLSSFFFLLSSFSSLFSSFLFLHGPNTVPVLFSILSPRFRVARLLGSSPRPFSGLLKFLLLFSLSLLS